MPQLALETFMTQYIWLLIVLSGFFALSTFYVIPRISRMTKIRDKVREAEELSKEGNEMSIEAGHNVVLNTISPVVNTNKKETESILMSWAKEEAKKNPSLIRIKGSSSKKVVSDAKTKKAETKAKTTKAKTKKAATKAKTTKAKTKKDKK